MIFFYLNDSGGQDVQHLGSVWDPLLSMTTGEVSLHIEYNPISSDNDRNDSGVSGVGVLNSSAANNNGTERERDRESKDNNNNSKLGGGGVGSENNEEKELTSEEVLEKTVREIATAGVGEADLLGGGRRSGSDMVAIIAFKRLAVKLSKPFKDISGLTSFSLHTAL